MKHILFDLFLVSLGSGIGVVTMCLVRAGSQFDRDMETWKEVRNNEFRTELIQLGFYPMHSHLCLWQSLLSGCISVSSVSFPNLLAFW